jgi:hypothetical protein
MSQSAKAAAKAIRAPKTANTIRVLRCAVLEPRLLNCLSGPYGTELMTSLNDAAEGTLVISKTKIDTAVLRSICESNPVLFNQMWDTLQ